MRALVGMGVVLGVTWAAVACSSSGGEDASVPAARSLGLLDKKKGGADGGLEMGGFSFGVTNAMSSGMVTGFSVFSDVSGGVGMLCITADTSGGCAQVPFAAKRVLTHELGHCVEWNILVSSMPSDLQGNPWLGNLEMQFNADGSAQTSIVQLVDLTGQETVGAYASANDSSWVSMVATDTLPLCITDTDCTLYGLDTTNVAYTCVNNTCTQLQPQPLPCGTQDRLCCTPVGGACSTTGNGCCAGTSCQSPNFTACLDGETDCACR